MPCTNIAILTFFKWVGVEGVKPMLKQNSKIQNCRTNALVKAQNFLPNVEKEGGRVKVNLNKLQDWYGEASLTLINKNYYHGKNTSANSWSSSPVLVTVKLIRVV